MCTFMLINCVLFWWERKQRRWWVHLRSPLSSIPDSWRERMQESTNSKPVVNSSSISFCPSAVKERRGWEAQEDTKTKRRERKGKEGRRPRDEWDPSRPWPQSSPLIVRKTRHITTWLRAAGHLDYMLERTLISLPWELLDWKWNCSKRSTLSVRQYVFVYM